MDTRYTIKFSIGFFIILILTVILAYSLRDEFASDTISDMDFVKREDITSVHISSSEVVETYRSTSKEDIDAIYVLLMAMEAKPARTYTTSQNYYKVQLSDQNNFSQKSYTFYDTGYVEINDFVGPIGSTQVVRTVESNTLQLLIDFFESGINQ